MHICDYMAFKRTLGFKQSGYVLISFIYLLFITVFTPLLFHPHPAITVSVKEFIYSFSTFELIVLNFGDVA